MHAGCPAQLHRAFGDDCNIFRKLEWKPPMCCGSILLKTPNASQCIALLRKKRGERPLREVMKEPVPRFCVDMLHRVTWS